MRSMTQDMGRLANGIAASRQKRMAANVERHREAGSRRRAVGHQLHEIRRTREKMSREQRRDAATGRRKRESEVAALLRQFHRNRAENATEARGQAAAFMRDLTGRVASLRDAFDASQEARAKSRHDLAKALHERLASYRQDRHHASAAWRGMPTRQAQPLTGPGRHRATHAMPGEDTGSP